jgi:uncharacterized protein YggL (DUF469 family)
MSFGITHQSLRATRLAAIATLSSAALLGPVSAGAQDIGADIAKAFQEGKFNVGFRYRYEGVEDDNPAFDAPGFDDQANASTLRSRLTYQSGAYENFSVLIEMDDLRPVGDDDYNSTRNGKTNRPVVADPEATDLNQAYIKYAGIAGTDLIIGRQRIVRGNERFIGPVGWRQNEQTFDAASVNYKFSDKLQVYYAYVDQVNRVFGPDTGTPPADLTGQTHLFDVNYTFSPVAKLTAYGYFIDLEEAQLLSSQTLGLRLAGEFRVNDQWSVPYAVEYASQEEFGARENLSYDASYDADYYLIEAGVKWKNVTARLAYEVLEGSENPNEAFQTPLATGHAFQGWADKFLTTPNGGIEDLFLVVDINALGGNIKVRYDDFQSETGQNSLSPDDYGDEIGIWATWPFAKFYSVGVKYANFSADSESTSPALQDTSKFWVILSANF